MTVWFDGCRDVPGIITTSTTATSSVLWTFLHVYITLGVYLVLGRFVWQVNFLVRAKGGRRVGSS